MKKLFFVAAAATAILASCQKDVEPQTNEGSVALSLSASAPTVNVQTKAAVDAWADTPIVAFATKTTVDGTESVFADKDLTVATDGSIVLEVEDGVPYFYAERAVYDFYAYYAGGADFTEVEGFDNTSNIAYNVEFDGSDDVMYAMADKTKDLAKVDADYAADNVTEADLYSAWAARRGVQPTLVFEHALTRFNFNVIGADEAAETVRIKAVTMETANTGVLTVLGDTPGFVAGADKVWLSLKNAADEEVENLEYDVTVATDDDELASSLMVAPEMTSVSVMVYMQNEVNGEYVDINEPYEIALDIDKVNFEGADEGAPTDRFAAGYAYDLNIKVYGPQAIELTAELTPWKIGGSASFDPDEDYRPGL